MIFSLVLPDILKFSYISGKSALIVCEDANLDQAVLGAILANYYSNGQVYAAPTHLSSLIMFYTQYNIAFELFFLYTFYLKMKS